MTGSSEDTGAAYAAGVRDLIQQAVTADDPYHVAYALMGYLVDYLVTEDFAGTLYVLWAAFTDWVELWPQERQQLARTEMRRAAREWLALDLNDHEAIRRYFHHWLDDIVGYGKR